jgi:FkbM family methyltransferase
MLRRILSSKDVLIETREGDRILVPFIGEPIAFHTLIDGVYEPETLSIIEMNLQSGGTFLDIGANVGLFAIRASKLSGMNGRVIAVEASPIIGEYLRHNLVENNCENVIEVRSAVSNERGNVLFWDAPLSHFGMGALAPQFSSNPKEIAADTIDNILASRGIVNVDLMKIDIEGFEAVAFTGAKILLSGAMRPKVIFEFNDWAESRSGANPGDAQRILLKHGYELFEFESRGILKRLYDPLTEGSSNLFAIPKFHGN